jgi:hypothetical protein
LTGLIAKEFNALLPTCARVYDKRYLAKKTMAGKPHKRKLGG